MASSGVNQPPGKFSQKTDIPIELAYLGGNGTSELELLIRYMYYRSSESRSAADPEMAIGQDYLRWYYDADNDSLDFVVCDGVGQSFLGYIASEFLGEKLLKWLHDEGLSLVKKFKKNKQGGFEEMVAGVIRSWQAEATRQVQDRKLPPSLPPMVRTALEDSEIPTEAKQCLPVATLSLEEKIPYLLLFWMGDVRFRLFDREGKEIETSAIWNNAERWSTKHGLKGRKMPHCWAGNLQEKNIARIMAYSDGLATIEAELPSLTSAELQDRANRLLVSPSSDDISLIDILLPLFDKFVQQKFERVPLITPKDRLRIDKQQISASEYRLSWEKIDKAEQYLLLEMSQTLSWREVFRSTELTSFSVKDRGPGSYQFRLRAVYPGADEDEGPECILNFVDTNKHQKSENPSSKGNAPTVVTSVPMQPPKIIEMQQFKVQQFKVQQSAEIDSEKLEWQNAPAPDLVNKIVNLEWKAVKDKGFEKYSIEVLSMDLSRENIDIDDVHKTSFEWHPKAWSGTYKIRIRAHKSNQLPLESETQVVTLMTPKPPAPVILLPKHLPIATGARFQLTCKSSTQPYAETCKYQWRVSNSRKMNNPQEFSEAPVPSLDHQMHKTPGFYYYQVRVEQNDIWSDWSVSVGIPVETSLGVPVIYSPRNGDTVEEDFVLRWSAAEGAEKYIIQYKSALIPWKEYLDRNPRKAGQFCECDFVGNETGKWKIRVRARDRFDAETISGEINITVVRKSVQTIVTHVIDVINHQCNPASKQCTIYWKPQPMSRQLRVFLYSSKELGSFLRSYDAVYDEHCSFPVATAGRYYVCIRDVTGRSMNSSMPTSNHDFYGFIMPLSKPNFMYIPTSFESQSADRGILKLEWYSVDNATSYRVFVNNVQINKPPGGAGSSRSVSVELSLGWNIVTVQAYNDTLDLESEYRTLKLLVEARSKHLEITDQHQIDVTK